MTEVEEAEVELGAWLVDEVENGIPEIVLIGLLRDYADDIEHLGYAQRVWGNSKR